MTEVQDGVAAVDLTNCDREPIHVPGRVQSHGVLLVLDAADDDADDLIVRHASASAKHVLGADAASLVGLSLAEVLDPAGARELMTQLDGGAVDANAAYLATVTSADGAGPFHAIVHRHRQRLFVELEPAAAEGDVSFHNLYGLIRTATGRLKGAASVAELCRVMAEEVRRITGFDRVMVYRFDADWHGTVLAEDKVPDWHSYLHLRFPASDIPRQARQLYLLNRLRLIADVEAEPADLVPQVDPVTGAPVDMSYAVLRSVSPIHIEYLRNMGVGASMSVSIVKDEQLWGLIACHHRTAKQLPYEVRAACEHLGAIMALQLSARQYVEGADRRIALKAIQSTLLAHMAAHENFVDGLVHNPAELLALAGAEGCAVCMGGVPHLVGRTPAQADVERLIRWLADRDPDADAYQTDQLPGLYPAAEVFKDAASGILAVSVPRFRDSYLLWFRPEVVRTVKWAGDPNKPAQPHPGNAGRIHPRKSFETWKQTVHGRSLPWSPEEVTAVAELRGAIVGIILRKAEELARINAELQRSNKELEAFSYSVSHDLRAPFRHIFGFSDLLQKRAAGTLDETSRRYIHTIMESARFAGTLVDSLLAFSQMSRTALKPREIDMSALVREVRADLHDETAGRNIEWRVGPLPAVTGDVMMLKLAVRNLLSNAVKYTRPRAPAVVEVGARAEGEGHVFFVRDNGVGFDMRFKDKLFGVFQRLHRVEEFEGTGIGLANVRRTIERHGGRTWAEGRPGEGATFYFSLPNNAQQQQQQQQSVPETKERA